MAEPSLEFLGKQIERLQVEMRHARAEIAALRNRVDANEVRIEEVVLMLNELREYVEARFSAIEKVIDARFVAMEKAIDARFKQVHETMANNLQVLLVAGQSSSDTERCRRLSMHWNDLASCISDG